MKTPVLFFVLLFLLSRVYAHTETRDQLVQEIVVITGVEEIVQTAKAASMEQTKEAVNQMVDQVRTGFPGLPKESWDAVQAAALKMVKSVENSWSTEDAVKIWKAEYVTNFTEDELRSILSSLKTPLGQKQIAANKKAGAVLQKWFLSHGQVAVEKAMKEYISDLQKIVAPKSE
ncbi:hypothetical protein CMV30_16230 [Nibricoccus aquaticus]|uniref:DUF2059 domain-containing protein n=1 Tax=Nibricoccus aquaticus TaxID=2576891 RepID=A0A290Q9K4_9BACT|nr:hypothetical protein [Nibricoccus aquaticus]ATC65365.1 hypothetical protein CMV30_16230 [Nibricoccus aquaticus]